jgi:hypothetical protein
VLDRYRNLRLSGRVPVAASTLEATEGERTRDTFGDIRVESMASSDSTCHQGRRSAREKHRDEFLQNRGRVRTARTASADELKREL